MFQHTLINNMNNNNNNNNNCSLQITGTANHPITSSDAMIKDYCKKEMMELQRQKCDPVQKQQSLSTQQQACSSSQNATSNENVQINNYLSANSQACLNDFAYANSIEQFNKYTNDEDSNNQKQSNAASAANGNQGRWTKEEHLRFVEGLSLYGKNWKKVEEHVSSRTGAQIRSHAQKFFNKLERDYNKKHGLPLPISLNTTSSTKQNNENVNSLPNNLSIKKSNSCMMMPQQQNVPKILGEKNQNNTKNILNNMQQQQFEQSIFFGQAIEASLQSAQNSQQNSLLKKTLLSNASNSAQTQSNLNPQLTKSLSQRNDSPQYSKQLLSQSDSLQFNTVNYEMPSLLPSISLRNRSDSVASNFTMMSDDDQKLTDDDLKKIKDCLPQMGNLESLTECISHYSQLTLNLQKQLLQQSNPQKNMQIQQQINTLQSAVQFLHAYSSLNKSPTQSCHAPQQEYEQMIVESNNSKAKNNNNLQQSLASQIKQKNDTFSISQNSQQRNNKENAQCSEALYQNQNKAQLSNFSEQKQQSNQIWNLAIQNPSTQAQEFDHPTNYESFFDFILKKYGKIFDQPQASMTTNSKNSNGQQCYQPRLNQFLNFDGDQTISRQNSNVLQSITNTCNMSNAQKSSLKNTDNSPSMNLPSILLRARKNSFTLFDNQDDQKEMKLNILRKKICTENQINNTNVIVPPSPVTSKSEQGYKNTTFSTILAQSPSSIFRPMQTVLVNNNENKLNQGNGTIMTNCNNKSQVFSSSCQSLCKSSGIIQPFNGNASQIVDIQCLLDDHHIGSTTTDTVEQQQSLRNNNSNQNRPPRFSFSDNNSQLPQIDSQQVIDEEIEQDNFDNSYSEQQEEEICSNAENEAIEEQQRKLLQAYQKLQQLIEMKNQQNPQKVITQHEIANQKVQQEVNNVQSTEIMQCNSPLQTLIDISGIRSQEKESQSLNNKLQTPQFNIVNDNCISSSSEILCSNRLNSQINTRGEYEVEEFRAVERVAKYAQIQISKTDSHTEQGLEEIQEQNNI